MGFNVQNYEQIRDAILRDVANQNPQAAVGADSDFRLRAAASAAAIEGLYQYQAWLARQILPTTADDDIVEQTASLYGLSKKAATAASGTIRFSGAPAANIGVGVECKSSDGAAYVTTAAGTIPAGGSIDLSVSASLPGLAGNQAANTPATLTSAPSGVSSSATIIAMSGGTETETIAALLARLLDRLQQPPAGGNKYDYIRWALDVPGVTQAFCYPLRRGAKTVDVAVLSNGAPPSAALLTQVQSYIDDVRPIGGDFMALAPQPVAVNISATLTLRSGMLLATVTARAQELEAAYFSTLNPGDTAYKSRIFSLLSDIDGVIDVVPLAPAANVTTIVDATHVQIPSLGTLTLGT
jgi:uncharacterized phage protein gp47/JayE